LPDLKRVNRYENKREKRLPFQKAYGESREDLIQEVDKSQLPEDITPEVGMGLVSKSADGNKMNLLIVEVRQWPSIAGKRANF
jgi:FKBP-type peptidyl-prolyl cis-trans isomerase SlpA